ncbi:tetratricopeptide repeat protein [Microcoleus sp. Pol12B5]|uniref:tetratricopeptide repeat protein n=1 Tax=Microcoleus sp. Pol12B5 TaxID=3055396 RepID=UPI002FD70341
MELESCWNGWDNFLKCKAVGDKTLSPTEIEAFLISFARQNIEKSPPTIALEILKHQNVEAYKKTMGRVYRKLGVKGGKGNFGKLRKQLEQEYAKSEHASQPFTSGSQKLTFEHTVESINVDYQSQASLRYHSNTPRSGAVEFVGRTEQLSELHQLLEKNNQVVIAAIAGMGGVGKTELAIQYAQGHAETYKGGICWLYPKRGDIGVQIVEFAIAHFPNFTLPNGLTLAGQVQFCWQRWAEGQVLIVIDDVADYRQIKSYIPSESRFKVLITTRERLGKPIARLDLDVLKPKAALALLKSLVERERLKREPWVSRNLCKWLGYLPLGLELVGQYLAQDEDLSLAEMLRRLKQKRLRHPALKNPEPTMTAQLGVADAFELSWERLNDAEQRLGCLLSLFAPAPIPWKPNELHLAVSEEDAKAIKEALESQGITQEILEELENSLEATEEAKNKLVRLNLLQPCGEGIYRFHQLIREFFRQKLEALPEAEELKIYLVGYIAALAKQIPDSPNHHEINIISPLIPHIKEIVQEMSQYLSDSDFGYPFTVLISFYENQGLYVLAADSCQFFIEKLQTRFHGNLLFVSVVKRTLAKLYMLQGFYKEAETLCKTVLASFKENLADQHLWLITIQYELALIYIFQNRFNEAEKLLIVSEKELLNNYDLDGIDGEEKFKTTEKISEDKEQVFIPILRQHFCKDKGIDILIAVLNTLGKLYKDQGRYNEAESLLKDSLNIARDLLDNNHRAIAAYKNNLASLYDVQGKYRQAEVLFMESLDILKNLFGEHHPDVASVLNNLGNIYRAQENYNQAESFFKQALEIRKNCLSDNHPDYAVSLNDLGLLYTDICRYTDAEQLLLKSLEIKENSVGKKHLDYAGTLNNLAIVYFYKNRLKKAELLYVESLQVRREILGNDHPDVASSFHNLADLYCRQGKFDEGEELWKKAFKIAFKTFGPDHPDTIMYQISLAHMPYYRTIPDESQQKLMNAFPGRFALVDIESKLKKISKEKRKAQGFGKNRQPHTSIIEGISSKDIFQTPELYNLVPVAQKIFSQFSELIKQQAVSGYQQLGKGIVLIEVQKSYEELTRAYVTQNNCINLSQNAPSEMWDSILMFLEMYNPKDYFIVLIVDPLENPGSNTCHHYIMPL